MWNSRERSGICYIAPQANAFLKKQRIYVAILRQRRFSLARVRLCTLPSGATVFFLSCSYLAFFFRFGLGIRCAILRCAAFFLGHVRLCTLPAKKPPRALTSLRLALFFHFGWGIRCTILRQRRFSFARVRLCTLPSGATVFFLSCSYLALFFALWLGGMQPAVDDIQCKALMIYIRATNDDIPPCGGLRK